MKKLLVAALLAATAVPAAASVVVYTDRAAFLAATTGTTTEGFDSYTNVQNLGDSAQFGTFSVASPTQPIYGMGSVQTTWTMNGSSGLYFVGTNNSLTASAPTTALGFDYGDYYGGTSILFATSVGNFQVTSANSAAAGKFFGLVSDVAFSSINWTAQFVKLDNVTVGTAADVPEPAMIGLFGLGALGLALGRRRKA